MAIAPGTVKCPRCGLRNPVGVTACGACGLPRSATAGGAGGVSPSPSHVSPTSPPFHSPSPIAVGVPGLGASTSTPSFLGSLLGRIVVRGVVIHIDPPYMARPEFNWPGFLSKGSLLIILSPVILSVGILAFLFSTLLSILGLRRSGAGFFSNVASQFIGFLLTAKALGPKADVPVRDVRLRDAAGNEQLVRFRGDFVIGNVNVGDDLTIEGFNRAGTLMFQKGYNHRILSEIRVKHR